MPAKYLGGERATKARSWQVCWAVDKVKEESEGVNGVTEVKKRDRQVASLRLVRCGVKVLERELAGEATVMSERFRRGSEMRDCRACGSGAQTSACFGRLRRAHPNRLPGPSPGLLVQWGRWGLRIGISNKLPDAAAAAGPRATVNGRPRWGGRKAQGPLRLEHGMDPLSAWVWTSPSWCSETE